MSLKYKNKKAVPSWIAAILKKGGELNQGSKPMEFVETETPDTVTDHTLDGYKLVNGKLVRDIKSSVRGYLRPLKESDGLKQYGENLYSKMKKGGAVSNDKKMVDGVFDILKRVKDTKNRRQIAEYMMEQFKKDKVKFDEDTFVRGLGLYAEGGLIFKNGGSVKDMPCNKPKRTPDHKTKSHVVKACERGKEKVIRFGQQGVSGSPKKAGESESYAKRRKSFKARHAKNIAKGKMSAAYWANREKW